MTFEVENAQIVQKPEQKYYIWRFLIVIGVIVYIIVLVLCNVFVNDYFAFWGIIGPIAVVAVFCYSFAFYVLFIGPLWDWLTEKHNANE